MSLQDLYEEKYGSQEPEERAKTAEQRELDKIASIVENFEDEESEKLAEACQILQYNNGEEFDKLGAEEKLQAAAELVDAVESGEIELVEGEGEGDESERLANEYDAAGRIMARGFQQELEELNKEGSKVKAAGKMTEKVKGALGKKGFLKYLIPGAAAAAGAGGAAMAMKKKKDQ